MHAYADDLQIYGHADPPQSTELMADMADCITSVETWMASNRLRLNPAKTDVIWLGTSRRVQQCTTDPLKLHDASIQPSNCVRNLGVVVDSGLRLVDHVTHITSVFLPHYASALNILETISYASSIISSLLLNSRFLASFSVSPSLSILSSLSECNIDTIICHVAFDFRSFFLLVYLSFRLHYFDAKKICHASEHGQSIDVFFAK